MRQATRAPLEKAARSIDAAEDLLHRRGDIDFAAGRAYYAMFYVAEALLHERDLASSKHSGVHALFGEHFAKPGVLDPKFHRWLLSAFDRRLQGDYIVEISLSREDVELMIEQGREFLATAKHYLGVTD